MGSDYSAPPPPDPVVTANAQGAINRETAYTNGALSRVNQQSPWGTQKWVRNTDTPGGKAWANYENDYYNSVYGNRGAPPSSTPSGSSPMLANGSLANSATADATTGDGQGSGYWETTPNGGDGGDVSRWVQSVRDTQNSNATPSRAGMPPPGIEDSWSLITELSPAQQKMLESQQRIGQNALNIGEAQLGRVSDALSTPLNADGLPDRIMSVPRNGPGLQFSIDPTQRGIQYGFEDVGGPQRSLDFSSLSNLPGINDFSGERQRVEDALYGRAASRLDPQWQQAETNLRTDLANRGITEGSAAWNSELDRLNREKTDAYQNATWNAINAGGTEQSRLFADALRGRQQGYTETTTAGQFGNDAQSRAYEQAMGRGTFSNAAQQQEYGQKSNDATFRNTAVGQQFGQDLTAANFANGARDAALTERATIRNSSLNDLRGLMGLGAIQAPQFGQPQTPQMAAPDLMGATYQSYNGQLQNAAGQSAAGASNNQAMAGVASAAIMAAAMM